MVQAGFFNYILHMLCLLLNCIDWNISCTNLLGDSSSLAVLDMRSTQFIQNLSFAYKLDADIDKSLVKPLISYKTFQLTCIYMTEDAYNWTTKFFESSCLFIILSTFLFKQNHAIELGMEINLSFVTILQSDVPLYPFSFPHQSCAQPLVQKSMIPLHFRTANCCCSH